MSQSYPKSTHVTVFPYASSERLKGNYQMFSSTVLNEHNLTGVLRALTDKKSYVLSYDKQTETIEFVLSGYYFKLNLVNITYRPLFASINLTGGYLSGTDVDGTFDGLLVSSSLNEALEAGMTDSLQLLTNEGEVPKESWVRFDSKSMTEYDVIYCGTSRELI